MPRRDDDYEDDDRPSRRRGTEFPTGVKIAGIIWIAYGSLGILSNIVNVVMTAGQAPAANAGPGQYAGVGCGILIAIAFLFVGVQTVKGTAPGTLGNGIGSLIIGILQLTCGGLIVAGGGILAAGGGGGPGGPAPPQAGELGTVAMVMGVVVILLGLSLITAGVLALMNKTAYEDWRAAQGLARPKRRTPEERDYDDDRRRRRPADDEDRPRRRGDEDEDRPRRPRRDDDE